MDETPSNDIIAGNIRLQADSEPAKEQEVQKEEVAPPVRSPNCWQLEYYQSYFDVSTSMVGSRIKKALIPHRGLFFGTEAPDLYGPIWIGTTLIFLLISTAHFASSLHTSWDFDITEISIAALVIYLSLGLVPFAVFCILSNQGSSLTLIQSWSLYGYSYAAFLPSTLISIAPFAFVHWLAFALSTLWGSAMYVMNLWSEIQTVGIVLKIALIVIGLAGHVCVFFVSNLYFYQH